MRDKNGECSSKKNKNKNKEFDREWKREKETKSRLLKTHFTITKIKIKDQLYIHNLKILYKNKGKNTDRLYIHTTKIMTGSSKVTTTQCFWKKLNFFKTRLFNETNRGKRKKEFTDCLEFFFFWLCFYLTFSHVKSNSYDQKNRNLFTDPPLFKIGFWI